MSDEKNLPSEGREFERGFGWKLLLSAAAHVLVLGSLLIVPGFMLKPQPKLHSYSVDLIDANKLGGTNLVAGAKGKAVAPPKIEPAKAKAPEPPPPPEAKEEPPQPEPPPEVKEAPPPPKEQAKPPAPPKEEPQPEEKAIALEKRIEPTPTQVQVAKASAPTLAPPPTAMPKAEPTKPKPTVVKAQATVTTQPKAVAQAKGTATAVKAAKAQTTPTKGAPQAVAKAQASPGAKAAGSPAKGGTPAAKKTPGADAAGRDDRIAAAIKRIEQKAGAPADQQAGVRGGGAGGGSGEGTGGPISIGPGEGAGGEVRSVAFIMYTNRLEALIKDKWVWAGQDQSLRADIGFNIMPNGEVVNVRTVASSGDPNYDRRAENAVRAAAPLPPPPVDYQEEFQNSGFVYTFEPN